MGQSMIRMNITDTNSCPSVYTGGSIRSSIMTSLHSKVALYGSHRGIAADGCCKLPSVGSCIADLNNVISRNSSKANGWLLHNQADIGMCITCLTEAEKLQALVSPRKNMVTTVQAILPLQVTLVRAICIARPGNDGGL